MTAPNIKAIFDRALELGDPAARQVYLDEACRGAADARRKVDALLQAYDDAGSFLEAPAQPLTLAAEPEPTDDAGLLLAERYKLLERIGEGGMGSVWMAEQQAPVRRLVAVKLIKPGMDSRAVLARFEAERQALALMDHPNIARVLDAGAAADGRPFFVMELVKGVPITTFCDENKLTPRQRLELFIPICQAIQHAHQKGIIHRDIKPTNVLIALYDGQPVPKVIDFGVAKAAGQPLTEKTLVTGFGAIIGTPEYMSPEQATFNQLDIDTRSDVYALGVLLYELLTGTTPVDMARLKEAAVLEVLRLVREEEPLRPSVKLSTTQERAAIAASRGSEPDKLANLLRGELDWIVLKALEKDRNRRYDTAAGLARDVERYLKDELVEARPPSAWYRLRKTWRRQRGPILAATVVLAALVAGVIGLAAGLQRAWEAEDELQAALRNESAQRQAAARALAAESEQRQKADRLLQDLLQEQQRLSQAQRQADREAVKAIRAGADKERLLTFFTMTVLAPANKAQGRDITLRETLVKAIAQARLEFGAQPLMEAAVAEVIGSGLLALKDRLNAQAALTRSYLLRKEHLGLFHHETDNALTRLADAYLLEGDGAQLGQLLEAARTEARATAAKEPRGLGRFLDSLSAIYRRHKYVREAIELRQEAVAWYRTATDKTGLGPSLHMLGRYLFDARRFAEAATALRESWTLHLANPSLGEEWLPLTIESDLGLSLVFQDQFTEAEKLLTHSYTELARRRDDPRHRQILGGRYGVVAEACERVLSLYEVWGKQAAAAQWRARLEELRANAEASEK